MNSATEQGRGRVSIGIVTYNSERYIEACIDSVLAQTWPDVELVVLDNTSSDDTVTIVSEKYPDIPLIRSEENSGFARGHNRIIARTGGSYYLPLNPDLVLDPHYVERMVEAIESAKDVGWASGRLYFMTREFEKTNRLYTTGHLIFRNGLFGNRGYNTEDDGTYAAPEEVFGANGAAPLYSMAMLEDIAEACDGQYLDESFFLPGSDTELDWRARLLGWRCRYAPEAKGYHVEHGSIRMTDPVLQREWIRRRYMLTLKCGFVPDVLFYYLPMLLSDIVLAAIKGRTTTLRAIAELPGHLPTVLSKRRQLVRKRRVSRDSINRWMQPAKMNMIYEF
jgi:GT2 family glycosyltransferase